MSTLRYRFTTAHLWFIAALVPMVGSQIVRLHQTDPAVWVICDYAGRGAALLVLAVIPAAREVAFQRHRLTIAWWELTLWVTSLVLFDRLVGAWIRRHVDSALPGSQLGQYPVLHGWVYVPDIALGLALVAYTEEILFRRCAHHVFRSLGDGFAMVVVTATIFAAYHWWSGVGNVSAAACFGGLAMVFYLRSGALWPVVLGHYVTDVIAFA